MPPTAPIATQDIIIISLLECVLPPVKVSVEHALHIQLNAVHATLGIIMNIILYIIITAMPVPQVVFLVIDTLNAVPVAIYTT